MKQELINIIKDNINGLSEKKKKGRKVGKLKFKSEVNSIPLIQYKNTYKILDENYVKIQGIKQYIRVRGLSQTPGEIVDFHVGMSHNHKFNIENMKEFDITEQLSMEDLTNIRYSFNMSKKLNKRFHSLPFYKLKKYVEYKANSEGIDVRFNLNGSINIAHFLMRDMGWRRSEPLFEPTNENTDVKSDLNVGSSLL